ncbi:MAG TPA: type II CAAX endopeptidase family protein [Gemmatimonadales bacterium]|nr:type II CAAX endopeptidase family protein [Gemmatimonadales bacterium]
MTGSAVPLVMPTWKAAGWSLAFLVLGMALTIVLLIPVAAVFPLGLEAPLQAALVQAACMLVAFGVATWFIGVRVLKLTPEDLRWSTTREGGRGFIAGLLLGAVPAVVALGVGALISPAGWRLDGGGFAEWLGVAALTGSILLPAAFAEEVIFRGVPLVLLAAVIGRWVAGPLLAGLFALAHLANPGITVLALANIALAGVFLTACFYLPGGLWTATGAHLGWNLTLAALAAPVSGLPLAMPMLDYIAGGPGWLTGGGFGPEGGLVATVILLMATVVVVRRIPQERGS